ncbi:MAG: glycosyltransferase family 2 protein [Desulfobacteraceae bacterium]|nr:MAG: glycosyltransferase family 2 protein [Desulfobacteraceae bacterium]
MDISIVIVNWNTRELLLRCLSSVFSTIQKLRFEVFVVDNASSDGSVSAVREKFPLVKVIENRRNLGFAAANNIALKTMKGRYAMLLNSDALLTPGAADELYCFMERTPKAAFACGQLLNDDGSLQNSVASFPSLLTLLVNETVLGLFFPKKFHRKRGTYKEPSRVDSCIGACMMVRKTAMDEVGLFDEGYFFFFEETDWALRMKKTGWEIYFVPSARIFHSQGKSAGHGLSSRIMFYTSRYRYFKKWYPKSYRFFFAVVFIRLVINICLCAAGVALTLGCNRSLRARLSRYLGIMAWHLNGCPCRE